MDYLSDQSLRFVSAYLRLIKEPENYVEESKNKLKKKSKSEILPVDFQIELILAK